MSAASLASAAASSSTASSMDRASAGSSDMPAILRAARREPLRRQVLVEEGGPGLHHVLDVGGLLEGVRLAGVGPEGDLDAAVGEGAVEDLAVDEGDAAVGLAVQDQRRGAGVGEGAGGVGALEGLGLDPGAALELPVGGGAVVDVAGDVLE